MKLGRIVAAAFVLAALVVSTSLLIWHSTKRRREIESKRDVAQWITGPTEVREMVWRRTMSEPRTERMAQRLIEDRLKNASGQGDKVVANWLHAFPTQSHESDYVVQAQSLCAILDQDPALPASLRTQLPDRTLESFTALAVDERGIDETRLRAFAWLAHCDDQDRYGWKTAAAAFFDLVTTRLLRNEEHPRWFNDLLDQQWAQESLAKRVEQTVRFGVDRVTQKTRSTQVDLTSYLGESSDSYAFALRVPFEELVTLCERLREDDYRPDAIAANPNGRTCNVIWKRDAVNWAIHRFPAIDDKGLRSMPDRLAAWQADGNVAWDVAMYRHGADPDLFVVTLHRPDSKLSLLLFGDTDAVRARISDFPYMFSGPKRIRSFGIDDSDWSFSRWHLSNDPGWRIRYNHHRTGLRDHVESESRQFAQMEGRWHPLPAPRYGPERRRSNDLLLAIAPDNELGILTLAQCQFHAGEFAAALQTLQSIKSRAGVPAYSAIAAARNGQQALAEEFLANSPPDDASLLGVYARALVWGAAGKVEQAIALLDRSVADGSAADSYNVACAYSMLLDAEGLSDEQRQHLTKMSLMIVDEVLKSGSETYGNFLNDNDMRPLLSDPIAQARVGIRDGEFMQLCCLSKAASGYVAHLSEFEAETSLYQAACNELKRDSIPVAFFLPGPGEGTPFAVWQKPYWQGHDGLRCVEKQVAAAVELDRRGVEHVLVAQWDSHPASSFRMLATKSLAQSVDSLLERFSEAKSKAQLEICRSVAEWLVLERIEDDPASAHQLIASLQPISQKFPGFASRLDYLSQIALGGPGQEEPGVDWLADSSAWCEVEVSEPSGEIDPYQIRVLATEVTNGQYRPFLQTHPEFKTVPGEGVGSNYHPATNMSWHAAAAFCNWLSERSGLATDQWVYEPVDTNDPTKGFRRAEDAETRLGFRLLSQAERDVVSKHLSHWVDYSNDWVKRYMWVGDNSDRRIRPAATRLPSRLGLHDVNGNVKEWIDDGEDSSLGKTLGGSSMTSLADFTTSIANLALPKNLHSPWVGFRIAQTIRRGSDAGHSSR